MSARRRAAGAPAKLRPLAMVDPHASQARPTPRDPLRVRPDAGRRPRTTAARRPAAPTRGGPPRRPSRVQRGADSAAAAPWTLDACPSGRLDTGRLDTGRLDTGRVDAGCPLDRWDGRPHDGTWTGQRPARPASGHPRNRRPPAGRPDLAGSRRLGALGHPERLRRDGTCAAALTAAGQLPSTAQQEAAPRRTALLDWIWRVLRKVMRQRRARQSWAPRVIGLPTWPVDSLVGTAKQPSDWIDSPALSGWSA